MIIKSLLDNDLYKFTMMQIIFRRFATVDVRYKFICRDKETNLIKYKDEIEAECKALCSLRFSQEDLDYIGSLHFMRKDFIDFLEDFRLKERCINISVVNGELHIEIIGSWLYTVLFEVPILSIVSEIYMKHQKPANSAFDDGLKLAKEKVEFLQNSNMDMKIADFGTRRRYSRDWHEKILKFYKDSLGDMIVGTSNIYFAKEMGMTPVGTMAHEYISAGQGLNKVQLVKSQQYMLEIWAREYRGELGIALSDTIGMKAFLKDFDSYFAKLYDGCRHDSSDPYEWGDMLIGHYEKLGIDPMSKIAVFSDSINPKLAVELSKYFKDRINIFFGIGTNITNDVGAKHPNIVMKLIEVNGNPVAKVSDNKIKEVCEDKEFLTYLKKVYGLKS